METDKEVYHATPQTRGRIAHETVDEKRTSNRRDELQSLPVISHTYGLMGKICILNYFHNILKIRKLLHTFAYQEAINHN